jgi:hypothetical protein
MLSRLPLGPKSGRFRVSGPILVSSPCCLLFLSSFLFLSSNIRRCQATREANELIAQQPGVNEFLNLLDSLRFEARERCAWHLTHSPLSTSFKNTAFEFELTARPPFPLPRMNFSSNFLPLSTSFHGRRLRPDICLEKELGPDLATCPICRAVPCRNRAVPFDLTFQMKILKKGTVARSLFNVTDSGRT